MSMDSFWKHLPHPAVGLSAMDGVTDEGMRQITKAHGNPDFMITEFTSADGIVHGIAKLLRDFYYVPSERPIVAQIFGSDPESFRLCSIICCALGFDGIDVNMGCPAPSTVHRGGGAALINDPPLAKNIVRSVKQGVEEWVNGIALDDLGIDADFIKKVKIRIHDIYGSNEPSRQRIPVSVKTRIGFEKIVTEEWISHLLETEPEVITVHGRILTKYYSGPANWEEIAKAARLIHQTETLAFGNGDLILPELIVERVKESGVDGVWIARAAMGNPWIFKQYRQFIKKGTYDSVTTEERFSVAIEHAVLFEKLNATAFKDDPYPFLNMRKHLGWYIKGFPNAAQLRAKLFQANSIKDVQAILLG